MTARLLGEDGGTVIACPGASMRPWSGIWLGLLVVMAPACTGGNGSGGPYDGGGGGGSGGSATGGGGGLAVGGAGGQSQSPGMAIFKVTVAPGSAYCDEESFC